MDDLSVRRAGLDGWLVEVGGPAAAISLAGWLRSGAGSSRSVEAAEVVPGATTVLLDGVPGLDETGLRDVLASWPREETTADGPVVEVPTTYDGPDLDDVAERWGTDRDGVVERHAGIEFVSAFCGFAPGFAYLSGLPDHLAVPRLATPRTRVRAGSVGLAGAWCGVYPVASPGGWRLLGTTDLALWDAARQEPALLAPGTRVRFVST